MKSFIGLIFKRLRLIITTKLLITLKNLIQILILLIVPLAISAQNSLSIKLLNPEKKVKPGSHFTMFVEVSSNKPFENKVEVELLLPEEWNVLMSKAPKNIKGEVLAKYMFTIATSSQTTKGIYNFGIRAFGKGYTEEIDNQNIEVEQIRILEIISMSPPEFVKEGDTLRTEYFIQNFGNNAEKINIKSVYGKVILPKIDTLIKADTTSLGGKITKREKKKRVKKVKELPFEQRSDSLTVNPNESVQLQVVQIIPKTNYGSWNAYSNLQVQMKDSLKPIITNVSIPVISDKIPKSDLYLRFPVDVGVWYNYFKFGDREVGGYQFDIRGDGDLDFAQKHHLTFIIHGPNRFDVPAVGSYDIYSLEYMFKKKTKFVVGDYNLRVSNLIELGRFGRGLRFDKITEKYDYALFYTKPRFNPYQKDTYGGSFTYKPSGKLNFTWNYVSKTLLDNTHTFSGDFLGISTKYNSKKFQLENEISGNIADGKTGFGFFNRLDWRFGRFQYSNNVIYTDKAFYGFYRNSYLLLNSINYNLTSKINLGLLHNITRLNPSLDLTVFNTSPYSQFSMAMINYQISHTHRAYLSYEIQSREDRAPLKSFNYKENYVRLSYSVNAQKFNLWSNFRYGTTQNLLTQIDSSANSRLFQSSIQPQFRILPWFWLGGYFDYQRTARFSNDNISRNFYFYGGTARINISKYFNANFSYRNNFAPDELIEKRSYLDLYANLQLGNHQFSIIGGRVFIPNAQFKNEDTDYFTIKYAFRINTPIARNKKLSSIKGILSSADYGINPKGIIVQMGDRRVLADATGYFQFNDLVPQRYFLNIVRSSMEKGVVLGVKNPIEVVVKSDTASNISIPLTKTGNILGKVNFIKSDAIGVIDILQNKPLVLVKIFNEKQSFLTQVNKNDEFSFKEMKPGIYKILAWIPGKTDQFTINNSDQELELNANKTREISISITPAIRKIQFSNKTIQLSTKR